MYKQEHTHPHTRKKKKKKKKNASAILHENLYSILSHNLFIV